MKPEERVMVRIERCDDEGCPGFGEQYVDRGYGYPVCPANALNPNPKPMDERYIGQFAGELVAGTVCNAPGDIFARAEGWTQEEYESQLKKLLEMNKKAGELLAKKEEEHADR
jgi:hypothetical protein